MRNDEFTQEIPVDQILTDPNNLENSNTSRRDFLKYIGFSTAAATLAACEGQVVKSIPYVVQPKEIIPGIANFYATTIANGFDFANILIKNREGRPIKVEKNSLADDSMSANARVHASVLDLYDNTRLAQTMKDNLPISWFTFEYETYKVDPGAGDGFTRSGDFLNVRDNVAVHSNQPGADTGRSALGSQLYSAPSTSTVNSGESDNNEIQEPTELQKLISSTQYGVAT